MMTVDERLNAFIEQAWNMDSYVGYDGSIRRDIAFLEAAVGAQSHRK